MGADSGLVVYDELQCNGKIQAHQARQEFKLLEYQLSIPESHSGVDTCRIALIIRIQTPLSML